MPVSVPVLISNINNNISKIHHYQEIIKKIVAGSRAGIIKRPGRV
jgi:hypothetical protein